MGFDEPESIDITSINDHLLQQGGKQAHIQLQLQLRIGQKYLAGKK